MDEKDSMRRTPSRSPRPWTGPFRPEGRTAGRSSSAWPPSRPSRWSRVACADTAPGRTIGSPWRVGACGSAVAAQKKAVDSYRTLLASDDTAKRVENGREGCEGSSVRHRVEEEGHHADARHGLMRRASVDGLDAARKKADGNAKRVDKASKSWGTWSGRSNRRNWTRLWRTRTGCTRRRKARSRTTRPAQVYWTPSTRRGRHCEGREGGQRFEDGEGEGRCRGRREGAGRTGGRGPGGRRTAGPTAGAGATLVLVWFVFVRRLVRFRRWTVLFRRIARPGWRLPERELPRAKHPLRLGRQSDHQSELRWTAFLSFGLIRLIQPSKDPALLGGVFPFPVPSMPP